MLLLPLYVVEGPIEGVVSFAYYRLKYFGEPLEVYEFEVVKCFSAPIAIYAAYEALSGLYLIKSIRERGRETTSKALLLRRARGLGRRRHRAGPLRALPQQGGVLPSRQPIPLHHSWIAHLGLKCRHFDVVHASAGQPLGFLVAIGLNRSDQRLSSTDRRGVDEEDGPRHGCWRASRNGRRLTSLTLPCSSRARLKRQNFN